VAGNERDLFDRETSLEEAACAFMTQVMEVKVFDAEFGAGSTKRCADGTSLERKNPIIVVLSAEPLLLHNCPSVVAIRGKERNALVVSFLMPRIFALTYEQYSSAASRSDQRTVQISAWRMAVATAKRMKRPTVMI